MRILCAILCLAFTPFLAAQSIDEDASRFLSSPHGRTGCYSPYRLAIETGGADTLTVQSLADGVVIEQQLAAAGKERVEVLLPVYVGESSAVRVGEHTIEPDLPVRRVAPDYLRTYAAVFSPDPVGARAVLPSVRERMVCDYFELSEFFTDWRLLDAYDALVIFNPGDARLPPGSTRAIAEFCSLGGAVFIGGSFRFGEKVVDLPAPVGPQVTSFRGTPVQRFGYGPGAIYRASWGDLTGSPSAQLVVSDALRDQLWFGAVREPGGEPDSRVPPQRAPLATPLPPEEAHPMTLFYGLAGGLLVLCLVVPMVCARFTKQRWAAHLCVLVGASGIAASALLQDRPSPVVEIASLHRTGEGEAGSRTVFRMSEEIAGDTIVVDLDQDRRLPKSLSCIPGWNAWVIFEPLSGTVDDRADAYELAYGSVGKESFRDFSTSAHRGNTHFSTSDAWLVEWWLDRSAYRGRFASFAPVDWQAEPSNGDDVRLVKRGAIRVTNERERR